MGKGDAERIEGGIGSFATRVIGCASCRGRHFQVSVPERRGGGQEIQEANETLFDIPHIACRSVSVEPHAGPRAVGFDWKDSRMPARQHLRR